MLQVKHDNGFMVSADMATLLAEWLAHHIEEADMGYVAFATARSKA